MLGSLYFQFFWITSRLIGNPWFSIVKIVCSPAQFYNVILCNLIFSKARNFAFFLAAHLHNGWVAIFVQARMMRNNAPWNFEIIFRHAVKTNSGRITGEKYLPPIASKKLRSDAPSLSCAGADQLVINLSVTVIQNDNGVLIFAKIIQLSSIVSPLWQSLISHESKNTSVRDFLSLLLSRLMVLSGSSRSVSLDTPHFTGLVSQRFKSRSIP